MAKARVVFKPKPDCSRNLVPYLVQKKTGLFKWDDVSRWENENSAIIAAKAIEDEPYDGQVIYETIYGYGD